MKKSLWYSLTFCLVFCVANASDKPTYVEPVKHAKNTVDMPAMTTEETCLLAATYREAGNQSIKGQLMVVSVVFNRMKKQRMSACQVVMQKGQWSWYKDRNSLKPTEESVKLLSVVRMALKDKREGKFVDYSNGATHFHTKAIRPWWSHPKHTIKVAEHQFHIFYKVRES